MFPFLRADERPRDSRKAEEPGCRVTLRGGVRHWFPGGTPEQAMVLVKAATPPEVLAAPETAIEYGIKRGPGFSVTRVIKSPAEVKREFSRTEIPKPPDSG